MPLTGCVCRRHRQRVRVRHGVLHLVAQVRQAAEDLLALFSGPLELVDGRAEFTFDLPPFDGTVRLMAVLWSEGAVGQASADVIARDPVVLQASLPRLMTPGDESRLRRLLLPMDR